MSRGDRRRDGAKESQWREVLARFASSELSVRAYCARERLSEASFYAWRRELALRDREGLSVSTRSAPRTATMKSIRTTIASRHRPSCAPTSFVPVRLTAEPAASSAAVIEVTWPTGVLLRVPSGCDPETLNTVLAALRNSQEPAAC